MVKPPWKQRLYTGGHRCIARCHAAWLCDYRWCEILLSDHAPRPVSAWDQGSLWMGEVGVAQLDWLSAFAPDRVQEFPARWSEGQRCFAAALERKCVGYVWVATGPGRLHGLHYVWALPPHSAWIFDALIHPLVLGTYPDLVRFTTARLHQQGFRLMLGQVEYDNRVSRRVHHMLGARRLGWVATLSLGSITLRLYRSGDRVWAFAWGRAPIPLAQFLPQLANSVGPSRKAA